MILSILTILFLISFFAFDAFNNKKFKEVIDNIEKTKAILNIETQGDELKKIKLLEQTEQILKAHKVTEKQMKKNLECMVDNERVEEIFKR
ncbi:MAG: hypothetical protein LBD32_02320 [Cytophagales bacterium]|jgi:tRNA pseudouridine-54 N-methylase|nr:hypothetical protein [Cytophagales bacterium]